MSIDVYIRHCVGNRKVLFFERVLEHIFVQQHFQYMLDSGNLTYQLTLITHSDVPVIMF